MLVLYLTYFIGFNKDVSTEIYHAFVALCYFTPLFGAMVADSYWGKYKTILWLSIVYLGGMVLMAISAIQFDENSNVGTTTNMALCLTALVIVACGTGGIKPCVSTLGGDQFDEESEYGRRHLADFFSVFYFAINAGSLCSTFITPLLRESEWGYPLAFGVPAALMFVALLAFLFGTRYYTRKPPPGVNIFSFFLGATWAAIRTKCKTPRAERNKENFMDYAEDITTEGGDRKYPTWIIRDAKWVWPIVVMYLPVTFFWALFDMQGSRWTLTATQMDGYWGTIKILPDQIQILNAFFVLLFLPIFQKLIYPCINVCFNMTYLRKMTGGQLIACLAFICSGFVQLAIQEGLTPVPDYGTDTAIMVTNGLHGQPITVASEFWKNTAVPEDDNSNYTMACNNDDSSCVFNIDPVYPRTPTFSWLYAGVGQDVSLVIDDLPLTINPPSPKCASSPAESTSTTCQKCSADNATDVISSDQNKIVNVVYYQNTTSGEMDYFQVRYINFLV